MNHTTVCRVALAFAESAKHIYICCVLYIHIVHILGEIMIEVSMQYANVKSVQLGE